MVVAPLRDVVRDPGRNRTGHSWHRSPGLSHKVDGQNSGSVPDLRLLNQRYGVAATCGRTAFIPVRWARRTSWRLWSTPT
jgi:hypothetical protein